ncbi:hypothetical protein EWM64_g8933 [Hericium alpestre]|uniref:Uncharacterized protein n=1 Tax=Hericium alpestre TaxID=135208 RepID=A0A4Y9ZNS9_9AGAM|nr:hypothetical protein EWM64_g8933 [Hericium alpestre]
MQYSSQFHRHQAIDLFLSGWDDNKYEELSAFLLNNYKQVGEILEDLPPAIAVLQKGKTAADTDCHKHLEAERKYLATQKKAVPKETWQQDYIELLTKYQTVNFTSNIMPGVMMERPHDIAPEFDTKMDGVQPSTGEEDKLEDEDSIAANEDDTIGAELEALHTFIEDLALVPDS